MFGCRAAIGWKYRPDVYRRNGLNSLSYDLIGYEERRLYTWIAISLTQPPQPTTKSIARDSDRRTASERDRTIRRRQREDAGRDRGTERGREGETERGREGETEREREVDRREGQRQIESEVERKREKDRRDT